MPTNFDITVNGGYYDGVFTQPRRCSAPVVEYPFADKGDTLSFTVRQKFLQSAQNYPATIPQPLSGNDDFPEALYVKDGTPRDVGGGNVEFERFWASVPVSRDEPESFIYQFQTLLIATTNDNGGVSATATLGTVPLEVSSTVTYEYFRKADIDAFALEIAPRVIELSSNVFFQIGTGNVEFDGAFQISKDPTILAENDTYGIYQGEILFRKRRQIAGPTAAFWGKALNLAANAGTTAAGSSGAGSSGPTVTSSVPVNFTVSPTSVLPGSTTRLTLTNLDTEHPWTTVVEPSFSPSVGTVAGLELTGPNGATLVYTAPSAPGQCLLTATSSNGLPWGLAGLTVLTVPLFTVTPANVLANSTTKLTFTGTGTTWTAQERFSAGKGTITGVVVDPEQQTATAIYQAPSVLGTDAITTTPDASAGSVGVTLF